MKKFLSFVLMGLLVMGLALATNTQITAISSLDGPNDYAIVGSYNACPTSTNTVYLSYEGGYNYFVIISPTAVGTSPTFNIIAGTNPPAFRAGIGDLAISLTNGSPEWVGPIETARFLNSHGTFNFSTTNVTTATMAILKVAR